MSTKFWANVHGGTTHFPIALLIASFVFDAIAYFVNWEPLQRIALFFIGVLRLMNGR